MKVIVQRVFVNSIIATIAVLLLAPAVPADERKDHPYRRSDVDMPVLLAPAVVRTPEFAVISKWYVIMIQVEKPLPALQMRCMMGMTLGPLDEKDCGGSGPMLRADWTVREGEQVVSQGSTPDDCACAFTKPYMFKFLGGFGGKAGHKYFVEVKFTRDGSPLDVAKPHLIVTQHRYR